MPAGDLRDLGRAGGERQSRLRGVDVAPLLRDTAEAGGIAGRRNRDGAFAPPEKDVLGRQAPVVGRTGLQVLEQTAVRQTAARGPDRDADLPAIRRLGIPGLPLIRPEGGDPWFAVYRPDRGIAIERQHRRLGALDVCRKPGAQVARRQHRRDGDRVRIVRLDRLAARGTAQRAPAREVHQRGSRRQGNQRIRAADVPSAACRRLQGPVHAKPSVPSGVEQARHLATLPERSKPSATARGRGDSGEHPGSGSRSADAGRWRGRWRPSSQEADPC